MSDLAKMIREVLNDTDLLSPDDVADEVVARTPHKQMKQLFRDAVRSAARQEITRDRMRSTAYTPPALPPRVGALPPRVGAGPLSPKVAAIRADWQRRIHERVYAQKEWKLLADCTYKDLLDLAGQRQHSAAQHHAAAARYETLAAHVKKHKVNKVSDLPANVLEQELAA